MLRLFSALAAVSFIKGVFGGDIATTPAAQNFSYPFQVLPLGCPDGFVQIPEAAPDKCYKLVLNDSDSAPRYINRTFVKMHEAFLECTLQQSFIARPEDLAQSNAIKAWLNTNYGQLFADNSPYGVWMGYRRNAFPVGELNYDTQVRPERVDPANYYDMYLDCPRIGMNPALWRNSSNPHQDQPNSGGRMDVDRNVFDERCVAMKKVSHPGMIGLDDYDCEDGAVHATLCEACFVEPMP